MKNELQDLSEREFSSLIENSKGIKLVDFGADWCAPCRALKPVLVELAEQFRGKIDFYKVDVDKELALSAKFGIKSLPTVILFKDGNVIEQLIGYYPRGHYTSLLNREAEAS